MRVMFVWEALPPYAVACLRALAQRPSVEVVAVRVGGDTYKAFEQNDDPFIRTVESEQGLITVVHEVGPDVVFISGWIRVSYLKLAWHARRAGMGTVCMSDTPWRATLIQSIRVLLGRVLLTRVYDAMLVPGKSASELARRLGFEARAIRQGLYSCDTDTFTGARTRRRWPKRFIAVGSRISRKGMDLLIDAYRKYRAERSDPWELWIVGDGPVAPDVDGVTYHGFCQPDRLVDLLTQAGCFVLASRQDNWPLALHEAVTAGLPVICSAGCANHRELVADNGYVVAAGDPTAIAARLRDISNLPVHRLRAMGKASEQLASRYTPVKWADTVLELVEDLR